MKKEELIERLEEWILEQKYQEYAQNTLKQYNAYILKFIKQLPESFELNKDLILDYKRYLIDSGYKTKSINVYLDTLNKFLKYLENRELCVKKIKSQSIYSLNDTLSIADYKRLLRFAKKTNDMQTYYIIKVLAMTGIRIGELKYITVENIKSNYILVFNKGKERKIILRGDLKRELNKYAKDCGINKGSLFKSAVIPEKMVNVSTVWRHLKKVASKAKVNKDKVHPHSFRHLFARIFLNTYTDSITELADILGHNSLETTRVYTRTSEKSKKEKLEKLQF